MPAKGEGDGGDGLELALADSTSDLDAAVEKLEKAKTPAQAKAALAKIEKMLEKNPADLKGLMVYWSNASDAETDDGEPDFALFRRAAELFRRAAKADKGLTENPAFKEMAAEAFYSDACAKAAAKKPAECVAALREALAYGWDDLEELAEDDNLTAVRASTEFKKFIKEAEKVVEAAREARKQEEIARIKKEMEETEPFDFTFDLKDVAGKPIAKDDFKGKVLIVDIWGTWCGPCLKEIPHFIALRKKYQKDGLEIVGLNFEGEDDDLSDETVKTVRDAVKAQKIPYSCALLTSKVSKQVPELEGFPTTLFFDRTGKLRLKAVGYHNLATLEVVVEELLKEKAE